MHHTVHPSRWCITRADLDYFEQEVRRLYEAGGIPPDSDHPDSYHDDPTIGPSMYRVNEAYIKPQTAEAGTSWALMRHPEGLPCDVFVTHCWSEGVFEFVTKVRQAWPGDAHHLYICFLSNPQNGDVSALLGEDPMESPFAQALCSAKYFLVIPNRRRSLYSRLWCVFEAHLALERGLIIRMPCQPKLSNALLALIPRCLLFFGCFGLLFWLGKHLVLIPGLHLIALAIMLGVRSLTPRFPQGTWMILAVMGMISGVSAYVAVRVRDHCHEIPVRMRVPVVDMGFFILVLAWDSLQQMCDQLLTKTLVEEGYQMQFDTVCNATASNPEDSQRIRAAIHGKEHMIDQSIQVLKAVGRYDKSVQFNMHWGMGLHSIRTGFQSCLAVGALYAWFLPFFNHCFAEEGQGWLSPTALRETAFAVIASIVNFSGACLELAGRGFYKDYAAFICQILFSFGLGRHLTIGIVDTVITLTSSVAVCLEGEGSVNVAISVGCALGAVAMVAITYCRGSAPQAALCNFVDVEKRSRLPGTISTISTCVPGDLEASARGGEDDDT
eukprot:TRINITY_DN10275_c0_g1_i1.p1 TRINITY_DN10275_c0_g1~~TRINITY_DN10275_c0_g1_i1.p1  ORF type:complete len:553 (+),score=54.33 TRINITY_DN10275_c0_g1_i1:101-1759(+)